MWPKTLFNISLLNKYYWKIRHIPPPFSPWFQTPWVSPPFSVLPGMTLSLYRNCQASTDLLKELQWSHVLPEWKPNSKLGIQVLREPPDSSFSGLTAHISSINPLSKAKLRIVPASANTQKPFHTSVDVRWVRYCFQMNRSYLPSEPNTGAAVEISLKLLITPASKLSGNSCDCSLVAVVV